MISTAFKLRQLSSIYETILIIYDRIDVALISNADGILLDKDSFNYTQATKLIENDKYIGFILSEMSEDIDNYDFIVTKLKSNTISKICYSYEEKNNNFDIYKKG